jgi:hypothetical protein
VLRADDLAVRMAAGNQKRGAPALAREIRGATLVADVFKGRARAALPAVIDGHPGAVWAVGGQVRAAFVFSVRGDRIIEIDVVMAPRQLAALSVTID